MKSRSKAQTESTRDASLSATVFELEQKLLAADLKIRLKGLRIEELQRENTQLRSGRSASMDLLQREIHSRDVTIIDLRTSLECLKKQLEWFRKSKFGSSSEAGNSTNTNNDANEKPSSGSKKGQKPGSKGHGRRSKSETPTVVKYLDIPDCKCEDCGEPFRLLNRTESSPLTEIEINLIRTEYQRCIYVSKCSCKGRRIRVADPPKKLFPRTEIGNSLWVWMIIQKFLLSTPQNRALKQLSLWGLDLAPSTVTGGSKVINDLLEPLMTALTLKCKGGNFWNVDETTWRVFGELKQRWWFWLIASEDVVVYLLDPSRSKNIPNEFFAASEGLVMSDRFSSYKSMQASIKKAWCWVHLRRDFLKVFTGIPRLRAWSKQWLLQIGQLYAKRHIQFQSWKNGSESGSDFVEASIALNDHVQNMKLKWESEVSKIGLHKEKGKILRSMKRHWPGLTIFLEDPRIALDNNRAERLLRNPVLLRKNSFGSGSVWAGQMAAKVFSLTQTWLMNGLDPQKLLLAYFDECSNATGPPTDLSQFLPWTMTPDQKARFALPDSYRTPG